MPTETNDTPSLKAKGKKEKKPRVSIFKLFRFATPKELCMVIIAIIFSAGAGAMLPVSIIIFGAFLSNLTGSLNNISQLLEQTLPVIYILVYMATAVLVASYISNSFWIVTGERQTRRIRTMYVHAILRQDMSWFDKAAEGSLNTRLATDTQLIQDGISEKFGQLVTLVAQFVSGFVVAFVKGLISIPS
jgi:ABC-type multidrug transport system fused ATPase/permease subunit